MLDVSSRNRNYIVQRRDGPGIVLKQGIGALAVATVAHEARVYRSLTASEHGLSAWMAPFHGYDEERGVLALGLVADGSDLRAHQLRTASLRGRASPPRSGARSARCTTATELCSP